MCVTNGSPDTLCAESHPELVFIPGSYLCLTQEISDEFHRHLKTTVLYFYTCFLILNRDYTIRNKVSLRYLEN